MKSKGHASLLALIVAGTMAGCQSTRVAPIDAGKGPFVLEKDEQKMWDEANRLELRIRQVGLEYSNEVLVAYLQSVATRLVGDQLGESGPQLQVRVLRMPFRGAFAFPNGVFYISTGMLSCFGDEAELATVLSHELTHFLRRHLLKEARSATNKELWVDIVGGATLLTGLAPLFAGIGASWANSALLGYSRELEYEADEGGLKLLVAAGYDVHATTRVFELLREEDELLAREFPRAPATHPRLQERLKHNAALLASLYKTASEESGRTRNREAYMAQIRQVLLDNAMLDVDERRLDFAARAVERYIAEWPDSAPGYFYSGEIVRCRREADAPVKAEAAYREAIRLDPSFADPHRELGLLLRAAGKLGEARHEFAAYVALAPKAVDAGIFRGYLKELDTAIAKSPVP